MLFEFHIKPKPYDCSKILNESTLFWINEKLHSKLIRRKKGQRLWKSHKDYISEILNKFPDHQDLIWRTYHLSNTTKLRLLKNLQKEIVEDYHDGEIIESRQNISSQAWEMIKALISPPARASTIGGVRIELFKNLNESYSENILRRYIKNKLHFSYKKGSCRPTKVESFQNIISTGLFAV